MSDASGSDVVPVTPDTRSGSPGAVLRRCREFHGITLEEASEATKIGMSHLKALEADQIRDFANRAYLKGFLRIYATYLGLNSDDVARMYDKLFGVQGDKLDTTRLAPTLPRAQRRLISVKKLLFPALLLTVILITATFFKREATTPPRQQQPAPITAPAIPAAAIQLRQSSAQQVTAGVDSVPPKSEKRAAAPPVTEKTPLQKPAEEPPKGFKLKIRVTQNGTLSATVDGSTPQQYELTIGDVIEWKAERGITLELSNAGGVDAELNGKPYKALGQAGKPAYVELDADGVK